MSSGVHGGLVASRCLAILSLVVCLHAQAAAGAVGKLKERASTPVSAVREPTSLALLALGLVGIGLHGLRRARRHR